MLDWVRSLVGLSPSVGSGSRAMPQAYALNDPVLRELLRGLGGGTVDAMRNAAVYRCVTLISNAIGSLPLQLMRSSAGGGAEKARDNALFDVLAVQANPRHSAFVFRRLLQQWVLLHGNAFARVVRSRGRVIALLPIHPNRVTVVEQSDFTVRYRIDGKGDLLAGEDVLHVMGPSNDGVRGMALMDHASDVVSLARSADRAATNMFMNGVMAGGVLSSDKTLGDENREKLRADLEDKFTGPEAAGRMLVLEEGLKITPWSASLKDAQNSEIRAQQVEEVARIFGVPRPFLMVDDTSWGSGIEQLGIFFVQYGLAPWFVAWEQAIGCTLLTPAERLDHYAKFNERALLRGSMKDQAEFFAKALGTGGGRAWMTQNEVRDLSELAPAGGAAGELGMGAMETVA
jgi:HK97 family phage portal protein